MYSSWPCPWTSLWLWQPGCISNCANYATREPSKSFPSCTHSLPPHSLSLFKSRPKLAGTRWQVNVLSRRGVHVLECLTAGSLTETEYCTTEECGRGVCVCVWRGGRGWTEHFWLATSCCCHSTRLSIVCSRPRLVYTRRLVPATYIGARTHTNAYIHIHNTYIYTAVYMYFLLFLMALLSDFRRFALNVIIATFYRHINIIVKFVIKKNEIASN